MENNLWTEEQVAQRLASIKLRFDGGYKGKYDYHGGGLVTSPNGKKHNIQAHGAIVYETFSEAGQATIHPEINLSEAETFDVLEVKVDNTVVFKKEHHLY